MPKVSPEILKWARETAGLGLDDAAKAIDLKAARGLTGAERLAALEDGRGAPSTPQLHRMAEKYRRPLITFYLSLSGRFPLHRKLARFTYPVWLYVSVTGVIVYAMLAVYR